MLAAIRQRGLGNTPVGAVQWLGFIELLQEPERFTAAKMAAAPLHLDELTTASEPKAFGSALMGLHLRH